MIKVTDHLMLLHTAKWPETLIMGPRGIRAKPGQDAGAPKILVVAVQPDVVILPSEDHLRMSGVAMRKLGIGVLVVVAGIALGGCAAQATGSAASGDATSGSSTSDLTSGFATTVGATSGGDPNVAGRQVAAGTVTAEPPGSDEPAMPGGSMSMCANETLQEAMGRSVAAGSSIVLATGGFTGNTTTAADGEGGVVYSEVQLDVERSLAGASLPESSTVWCSGISPARSRPE